MHYSQALKVYFEDSGWPLSIEEKRHAVREVLDTFHLDDPSLSHQSLYVELRNSLGFGSETSQVGGQGNVHGPLQNEGDGLDVDGDGNGVDNGGYDDGGGDAGGEDDSAGDDGHAGGEGTYAGDIGDIGDEDGDGGGNGDGGGDGGGDSARDYGGGGGDVRGDESYGCIGGEESYSAGDSTDPCHYSDVVPI